jgi:nitrite reductase/ring-hydroxylating ferredoxin subunit
MDNHNSCFDVTDGSIVCRPATRPLETFSIHTNGEIGWVEPRS